MSRNGDFEMVQRPRRRPVSTKSSGEVSTDKRPSYRSGRDALMGAAADNMEQIINLANKYMDIGRLKAETDAQVALYAEQRKNIELEAEVYVRKLRADNEKTIHKINKLADILHDFWQTSRPGEELTEQLPIILAWLEKE